MEENKDEDNLVEIKEINDIKISFHQNKVRIHKASLIYDATFDHMFKLGFIHHEFKNDDKAKHLLIKHHTKMAAKSYQCNQNTYIEYNFDYFDILIKIPTRLFHIDLANCSQKDQLIWYKNKYEQHLRILRLNNCKLHVIKIDKLHDNNFIFKIYEPDEILYQQNCFNRPKPKDAPRNYDTSTTITKDEMQINLLAEFYSAIKSKYKIRSKFNSLDESEISKISLFLSQNKFDVTQGKYYKKIDNRMYFIEDNKIPNILIDIYDDKVNINNLQILFLKSEWITCLKDISSHLDELIGGLTKDYTLTKIQECLYLMDKVFESDIFAINVSASSYHNYEKKYVSFTVNLLYKMKIKHGILSLKYCGAMQYYNHNTKNQYTHYQKYDETETIPIKFEASSKAEILSNHCYHFEIRETKGDYNNKKKDCYKYSMSSRFPVDAMTLHLI